MNKPSIARGAAAGVLAGLLASFAMDRFQALVAAGSSSASDSEPATDKTADRISKALTGNELASHDKPLGGQLVHYALGAGLGALYGLAAEYRRDVTAGYGTAFGLGVAALVDNAAVPAMRLGDAPWNTSVRTHVYSLASHIVFGAATEFTRSQVRSTLGARDV